MARWPNVDVRAPNPIFVAEPALIEVIVAAERDTEVDFVDVRVHSTPPRCALTLAI